MARGRAVAKRAFVPVAIFAASFVTAALVSSRLLQSRVLGAAPLSTTQWGAYPGARVTTLPSALDIRRPIALPDPGAASATLWDVGAGSASVSVECLRVAPWVKAIAVERDPEAAESCRENARSHQVALRVCEAEAPSCFDALPAPNRVFVGGGGVEVVRAARERLRPGGVIVATFAALDRAAAAADLLGNLTQLAASRGRRLPDGGWRLEAANPTVVTWGNR